jgi:hypothetical protein
MPFYSTSTVSLRRSIYEEILSKVLVYEQPTLKEPTDLHILTLNMQGEARVIVYAEKEQTIWYCSLGSRCGWDVQISMSTLVMSSAHRPLVACP